MKKLSWLALVVGSWVPSVALADAGCSRWSHLSDPGCALVHLMFSVPAIAIGLVCLALGLIPLRSRITSSRRVARYVGGGLILIALTAYTPGPEIVSIVAPSDATAVGLWFALVAIVQAIYIATFRMRTARHDEHAAGMAESAT